MSDLGIPVPGVVVGDDDTLVGVGGGQLQIPVVEDGEDEEEPE